MQTSVVQTFEIGGFPGRYFECMDYRATLTTTRCAQNHLEAQQVVIAGRLNKCRDCKIGALHAGKTLPQRARKMIHRCCRCHNRVTKLVRGVICVSCFNREREVAKGRNAKGTTPHPIDQFWRPLECSRRHKTAVLHRLRVGFLAGGQVLATAETPAVDTLEVMLAVIKKDPAALFYRQRPVGTQLLIGHASDSHRDQAYG